VPRTPSPRPAAAPLPLLHPATRAVALVGLLAALALTLLPAPPAGAHPFGDPQTADVTSTDHGVQVHWQASPDDVTALGVSLGVLESTRAFVFKDGALVPEKTRAADGVELAKAPELATYLLDHVAVRAQGRACTGTLEPVDDVTTQGATLTFDCGGPVAAADVTLTTLTDLHRAYRTLAVGGDDQRYAYSADADTFTWSFPTAAATGEGGEVASGSTGRSAALQLGGVGLGVVVVGGLGYAVVRRRARRVAGAGDAAR